MPNVIRASVSYRERATESASERERAGAWALAPVSIYVSIR
jgi:hypothetical protein